MRRPWPTLGRSDKETKNKITQDKINNAIITLNLLNKEPAQWEE
jgi:hypothetical protein